MSRGVILNDMVYRSVASKTFDDRYLKNEGIQFFIYALVAAKKKPKLSLFRPIGKKAPLPSEVTKDLTPEQKEYAEKKKSQGQLWFLKLEDGWDWTKAGGAKGAKAVQEVLNYLKKFKAKDKVGGVEAIYIETSNRPKKAKKSASVEKIANNIPKWLYDPDTFIPFTFKPKEVREVEPYLLESRDAGNLKVRIIPSEKVHERVLAVILNRMPGIIGKYYREDPEGAFDVVLTKKPAVEKTAGWWSSDPLGGDTPLDMMGVLEEKGTPEEGVAQLREWFGSTWPDTLYSAVGIWDWVMQTGPEEWKAAFASLRDEIPQVAREALSMYTKKSKDPDAGIRGARWLKKYMRGKSGLIRHHEDFAPVSAV